MAESRGKKRIVMKHEEEKGWNWWVIAIIIFVILIICALVFYYCYYSSERKEAECEDGSKKDDKPIAPIDGIVNIDTYREWSKNGYNCSKSSVDSHSRSVGGPYAFIDDFHY